MASAQSRLSCSRSGAIIRAALEVAPLAPGLNIGRRRALGLFASGVHVPRQVRVRFELQGAGAPSRAHLSGEPFEKSPATVRVSMECCWYQSQCLSPCCVSFGMHLRRTTHSIT
jgi:hypothetical protein